MNKKVNIFLDDVRDCPEGFILARSVGEAIRLLHEHKGNIRYLSLDHDLGENQPEGYKLCCFMVDTNIWADEIFLHTANPVGRANMYQLLTNYKPGYVKVHRSPMVIG